MLKRFGFLVLCFTIAVHAIEADDDVDKFELRKLKVINKNYRCFSEKKIYGIFLLF